MMKQTGHWDRQFGTYYNMKTVPRTTRVQGRTEGVSAKGMSGHHRLGSEPMPRQEDPPRGSPTMNRPDPSSPP